MVSAPSSPPLLLLTRTLITRPPGRSACPQVILLVVAFVSPFATYAIGFKNTISLDLITAAGSESVVAFDNLGKLVGALVADVASNMLGVTEVQRVGRV